MASYDIGNVVRVTATFTDPLDGGAAIDPTAVYAAVRKPSGVVTTYAYGVDSEVSRSEAGVYYTDVDLTVTGRWYVRMYSTGNAKAAEEVAIGVTPHRAVAG